MLAVKLEIGAEIRRADGTVRRSVPFRQCHCLLKQFIMFMAMHFSQTTQTMTDIGGDNRGTSAHALNFAADATSGTSQGIVIGTGTTTVTLMDHKLETQITAGIAHETVSFNIENPDSSTWSIAISRSFLNNTGGIINIQEVALYVSGGASYFFCIDRTLYPVTLEAGEAVALTYRISATL